MMNKIRPAFFHVCCVAFLFPGSFPPAPVLGQEGSYYFPGSWGDWESISPEEAGLDEETLEKAIEFAKENESQRPKEIDIALPMAIGDEPYDEIIGPVKDRGDLNGIILRYGRITAEWGDTKRVDMTFSVTKSYLSTVAGLAFDRGIIRDVHDPVCDYVQDGGFDSDHNRKITWHMLLNQTSEWEGTLWGKPDWADRWGGTMRELREPGTHWRYNDVRVNRLALALLQVLREPLPQVLKENVMDPIGGSPTWRWHGYENSWVNVDGIRMQSVSGGGHWGGGMWISTRDHARFGYLFLRRGRWREKRILSEKWIDMALTPTEIKPTYGYMNWEPNTHRELYPSAPENNFFAHGAGTNVIWVDPEHDIVSVVRWIEGKAIDEYVQRVLDAIQ